MQLYNEIFKDLLANEDENEAEKDKRYHKYPGFSSLGIKAPILHKILKPYKKKIEVLSCSEALDLAMHLSKKHMEELTHAANFVLQNKLDCLTPKNISFLDEYVSNFTSWSQTDDFAIDVLGPLLMKYPDEILELLKEWNTSKNMWKRRLSVVAFVRNVGKSGKFTRGALKLCENLLFDEEDLVKKGVGWCLKDIMRADKELVLKYVMQLKQRNVSSTITLYALRDVKRAEKALTQKR